MGAGARERRKRRRAEAAAGAAGERGGAEAGAGAGAEAGAGARGGAGAEVLGGAGGNGGAGGDREGEGGRGRPGPAAGGSGAGSGAAPRNAEKRRAEKRAKREKLRGFLAPPRGAGAVTGPAGAALPATPAELSERPFDAEPEDHCETPLEAFRDVEPLLFALTQRLGRAKGELAIYDPFFCEGSMKQHLGVLGFANVRNERKDFYAELRAGRIPAHDVLVTNPPFSGDHIQRTLRFAASGNECRPYFLLLPNFVCRKRDFTEATTAAPPGFLIPRRRYTFWSPGRGRSTGPPVGGAGQRSLGGASLDSPGKPLATAPFDCLWYVNLGPWHAELSKWFAKKCRKLGGACRWAGSVAELPEDVRPKRTVKRPNPKARKRSRLQSRESRNSGGDGS